MKQGIQQPQITSQELDRCLVRARQPACQLLFVKAGEQPLHAPPFVGATWTGDQPSRGRERRRSVQFPRQIQVAFGGRWFGAIALTGESGSRRGRFIARRRRRGGGCRFAVTRGGGALVRGCISRLLFVGFGCGGF